MGSSTEKTVIRLRNAPESIQIVNWPLRDESVWSALALTVFVASGVLCSSVSGNPALGILCFVLLALSAWRLWLPVTFSIGSRGIIQTIMQRQWRTPWSQIARYKLYPRGILLLADAEPMPLAPLRGLYIRFDGRRDELLNLVRFFLEARQPVPGSTRSFAARAAEPPADGTQEIHAND